MQTSRPHKFLVQMSGSFYVFELYSQDQGDEIFDLQQAIEEAESQYPGEWVCVYNGTEAANREDVIPVAASPQVQEG